MKITNEVYIKWDLKQKKKSHDSMSLHQTPNVFIQLPERRVVAHMTYPYEQFEGTAGYSEGRWIFPFNE